MQAVALSAVSALVSDWYVGGWLSYAGSLGFLLIMLGNGQLGRKLSQHCGKIRIPLRFLFGAFLCAGVALAINGRSSSCGSVKSSEISLDLTSMAVTAARGKVSDVGQVASKFDTDPKLRLKPGLTTFNSKNASSAVASPSEMAQADSRAGVVAASTVAIQKTAGSASDRSGGHLKVSNGRADAFERNLVTVRPGDTLVKIFKRHHLKDRDALQISRLAGAEALRRLQVGKTLQFTWQDGQLKTLEYNGNHLKPLVVSSNGGGGWICSERAVQVDRQDHLISFDLGRNFIDSCVSGGLPRSVANEAAQALGQRVNLRALKGDERLSVAYRELRVGGKLVKKPELVGLDYYTRHKKLRLIAFVDDGGRRAYFTPDGHGTQPQFDRYPLSGKFRVSSRFARVRKHPVLGELRPHLGVDLAASYGTPVHATSDGVIDFTGFCGGYGRLIVVKNGKYSTRYAHLSRYAKGVQRGTRVKRGEVIGYVGSSGMSTSAHLHYEFRVGGMPYDPMKVRLPGESMLAGRQRNQFIAAARQANGLLDHNRIEDGQKLAAAERTQRVFSFGKRS